MIEKTKYNGTIDLTQYEKYCVNGIYKILALKDDNKEWYKYLPGFLVELTGFAENVSNPRVYSVINKLEGLLHLDPNKEEYDDLFRKIVLDCISLIKKIFAEWEE